jgi:hypothetical protein
MAQLAVVDFLFLRVGQLRFDDLGSVLDHSAGRDTSASAAGRAQLTRKRAFTARVRGSQPAPR